MAALLDGFSNLQIILPPQDPKLIPVLNLEQVDEIPQATLAKFFALGEESELGNVKGVTIRDVRHHLTVERVVQWVTLHKQAPFLVVPKLEVQDKQRDKIPFVRGIHADDVSLESTNGTRQYFVEEVDQYVLSVLTGLNDLRDHLSESIRSCPVYSHEITILLNKLFVENEQVAAGMDDKLRLFIRGRVRQFRATLETDSVFLHALSGCVDPRDELSRLFDHLKTAEPTKVLPIVRETIGSAVANNVLVQTFEETHLTVAGGPGLNAPYGPLVPIPALPDKSVFERASEIIFDGKSVVFARADNPTKFPHNSGFRFYRWDILIVLGESGPKRLIVRNKDGEVGEIAEALTLPLKVAADHLEKARAEELNRAKPQSPAVDSSKRMRRGSSIASRN